MGSVREICRFPQGVFPTTINRVYTRNSIASVEKNISWNILFEKPTKHTKKNSGVAP